MYSPESNQEQMFQQQPNGPQNFWNKYKFIIIVAVALLLIPQLFVNLLGVVVAVAFTAGLWGGFWYVLTTYGRPLEKSAFAKYMALLIAVIVTLALVTSVLSIGSIWAGTAGVFFLFQFVVFLGAFVLHTVWMTFAVSLIVCLGLVALHLILQENELVRIMDWLDQKKLPFVTK